MSNEIAKCPNPESCPFCLATIGYTEQDNGQHGDSDVEYRYTCEVCGAKGPGEDTEYNAVLAWNYRGEPAIAARPEPQGTDIRSVMQNPAACSVCGKPAFVSVNIAPHAAAGGVMQPRCDEHNPWASHAPKAVPGWKLVPVEPTKEMIEAAYSNTGIREPTNRLNRRHYIEYMWQAMLLAAPPEGMGDGK